jgi:hypothetical protein
VVIWTPSPTLSDSWEERRAGEVVEAME